MIDKARQIFFKILQMDVGTEHLLGWCKNKARRKIQNDYKGDERVGFRSAGNIGDVSYNVKTEGVQGGDVYVRISMTVQSDISAYFGYAGSVEMRCWCRGLELIETVDGLRFAIFMTDGTELASVVFEEGYHDRTTTAQGQFFIIIYRDTSTTMIKYQIFPVSWSGNSNIEYTEYIIEGGVESILMMPSFAVADDACYQKIAAPTDLVSHQTATIIDQYTADWNAAQVIALTREHVRRKKCSDGQIMLLRNGFLPPEFEYFIKTQAPVSMLLKRALPMEIVSTDYQLVSDTDDGVTWARNYTASVVLKYTTVDVDGNNTDHQQQFDGSVLWETITHTETTTGATYITERYTSTNLPTLEGSSGSAGPFPNPLPSFDGLVSLETILHDNLEWPLMGQSTGVFNYNSSWHPNNQYTTTPTFQTGTYTPEFLPLSNGIVFSNPQFLLDYITASKPVEFETVDGTKVSVTPSTDWLSSRLADKEIVTVIPLSFMVDVEGVSTERGMFRYVDPDTPEVPTQIALHGYAKFQYDYFTGTFTFKSWTEFTDQGKVTVKAADVYDYNDEITPTALTTAEGTFTLTPILFNYNAAWTTPNCVCIGDKNTWTDTEAAAKAQAKELSNNPPVQPTDAELLYKAVKDAIAAV